MLSLFNELPWLFYGCVIFFSLLVGSFLNVVIYRLPIMMQRGWDEQFEQWQAEESALAADDTTEHAALTPELETHDEPTAPLAVESEEAFNLLVPRSRCPKCEHQISAIENVPLLSWLVLRGRCRACEAPISARYPFVEAITALLSLLIAMRFGVSAESVVGIVFVWALIALTGIDFDHQLLPDSITLPLLWLGLGVSLFSVDGAQVFFISPSDAIVGALVGYLSLWSVYHLFRLVTGKEGMGYGDFKLLAAIGAWLGWQALPLVIMLSALLGATVGLLMIAFRGHERSVPIPFGPWLALAAIVSVLGGDYLSGLYFNLIGL